MASLKTRLPSMDPRVYQISVLSVLLVYGMASLEFDVKGINLVILPLTAFAAQFFCTQYWRLPKFDPASALISSLSLCLLLRTNHLSTAILVTLIAISSKFLFRWNGKHIFNPTNVGIVLGILLTGDAWVSPGQWGSVAFFGFSMACLGGLVVNRSSRSDITYGFLFFYLSIIFGRAIWLGQPLSIPFHMLQNGAFLLFTFFMISDPKTTPDSRAGRLLFAFLVAAGAGFIHFVLYRPNGLIWSLSFFSLATPLIDQWLPGLRFQWKGFSQLEEQLYQIVKQRRFTMKTKVPIAMLLILVTFGVPQAAFAFCGFYVAKADAELYNKASQVVLARHDDKTVLTLSNDYKGDPKEFAMVIPVPTLLKRDQIHVGEKAILDHLDAYSSPRLVEYYDGNPCALNRAEEKSMFPSSSAQDVSSPKKRAKSLGVTIEAQYTVGEYDILILSAKQSNGLQTWLRKNDYKIPKGATRVLRSYIKQGMKFFVAKVNLKEQAKLGFTSLRPLQVAYESPKFMLPIRLGMVNADGPQELFIYTLTRKGRVETTNYRTVKLPTGKDLPIFIKHEFGSFYKDMFTQQTEKENRQVLFQEYAWDMNWCDPCAADPLSRDQLRQLGVFWLKEGASPSRGKRKVIPPRPPTNGAQDVFLTRLHVRYDKDHFPEDLVFQETADRQNFQARYVLRHPWSMEDECSEILSYRKSLRERQEREAQTLASLTGWDVDSIREKINFVRVVEEKKKWYQWIWD